MLNQKIINQINIRSRLDTLRDIAGFKQSEHLRYGKRRVQVDMGTAKLIVQLYDSLQKQELKDKLERMLETPAGLNRLAQFAWERATFK